MQKEEGSEGRNHFSNILQRRVSRRRALQGAVAIGAGFAVGVGVKSQYDSWSDDTPVDYSHSYVLDKEQKSENALDLAETVQEFLDFTNTHFRKSTDQKKWDELAMFISDSSQKELSERFGLKNTFDMEARRLYVHWPEIGDNTPSNFRYLRDYYFPREYTQLFGEVLNFSVDRLGDINWNNSMSERKILLKTRDQFYAVAQNLFKAPAFNNEDDWTSRSLVIPSDGTLVMMKEYQTRTNTISVGINSFGEIQLESYKRPPQMQTI